MRLDKFLCEMKAGSRSQVRVLLRQGLVTVNGAVVTQADQKIDENQDSICLQGRLLQYQKFLYFMLHKPGEVVSATCDNRDKTVLELLRMEDRREDLFPVGRLDKDTEGLLLITNDGGLAHRLLSPKKHVDKVYYARVQGRVTQEDAELFRRGVDIGEKKKTLPAELRILNAGEISEIELTIREGKFHQVKRMFHAAGKEVLYLKRLQMGPLRLDESLKPGEYRTLNTQELDILC